MNVIANIRDEKGFTIQELMVVLIVGSLLVSFSFSLFLFGQKLFTSWQKKTEVRTSVTRVLQTISLDILQSNYVAEVSDTALFLTKQSGFNVKYRFDGTHVWRNGEMIIPGKEISLAVSISEKKSVRKYPPLLHIEIEGTSPSLHYSSESEVAPPLSSKANFISEVK
jgi:prepilin-type N-terminal cleavage/methylation domain-containing protein